MDLLELIPALITASDCTDDTISKVYEILRLDPGSRIKIQPLLFRGESIEKSRLEVFRRDSKCAVCVYEND